MAGEISEKTKQGKWREGIEARSSTKQILFIKEEVQVRLRGEPASQSYGFGFCSTA